jgi:hypothetical protein
MESENFDTIINEIDQPQLPNLLSILKKPKPSVHSSIMEGKETFEEKIVSNKRTCLILNKNKLTYLNPRKYSKKIYITRNMLSSEKKIPKNEMPEKLSNKYLKGSNALLLNNKRIDKKDESYQTIFTNYNLQCNQIEHNFIAKSIHFNIGSIYLVEIRAVVLKLGGIDTLNEKFSAEAFIEAKWIDVMVF